MKTLVFLLAAFGLSFTARAAEGDHPVLRIGYQKSGAFLLVKHEGGLEKRLAPLGWKIEWNEFIAGVPLLEALGAGKLDLGHSGDAPVIFAQVADSPLVYLATTQASPTSVGILVPQTSTLRSLVELKGKRVIVGKGSSAHFFVARALESVGLTPSDITFVYLNPGDARAAFERGDGDAWAVWDPFLAAAEITAQARVLRNGEGLTPFREFYVGHRDFVEKNAAVISAVLAELEEVGIRAKQDPKKIAAFLAPQLKIDLPTLEKSEWRKFRYGAVPLSNEVIAEQQGIANLFYRLGLVPKHVNVADIVWRKNS